MRFSQAFMDADIVQDEEVSFLLEKISCPVERVSSSKVVYDAVNNAQDPISAAKKILYITRNRGAVVRECPGTSFYTCCDYTILHTGTFCTMDCSYCILQAYFHPPVLQYFAGFRQISQALKEVFSQNRIFRVGTGEYTDSLIWEPISLSPAFLVETFARQSNCLLELKTKTINVDSLLTIEHNEKTVLSWSVNTPVVIREQERGTTSLAARLRTARQCQEKGFQLAFHFDPLVIYPGCEAEYEKVVDDIFAHVSPEHIVYISLGSFRFMPKLKPIVENRFPDSVICYGEFITGLDNKMRYFKPLRIRLYQTLVQRIRAHSPQTLVYFCMEDQEVWEKCMGFFPGKQGELGGLLDDSAILHCKLRSF